MTPRARQQSPPRLLSTASTSSADEADDEDSLLCASPYHGYATMDSAGDIADLPLRLPKWPGEDRRPSSRKELWVGFTLQAHVSRY